MVIKKVFGVTAALLWIGPLTSAVFGAGETIDVPQRPVPSPATVAIVRDNTPDYAAMVAEALESALGSGGISNLVHSGQTVVIKPNLVTNTTKAVTDWRMVQALVNEIKSVNGGAAITIAEGSATNSGTSNTHLIMAAQGFTADHFPGVALVDINSLSECPTNYFVLADGASDNTTKQVAARIYEADIFINCPKMKTHYHAGITGATKNIGIGVPSWSLWNNPGSNNNKGGLHNDIRREILDHIQCRVPDLTLMDAIQAMEGQGPVQGNPVTMNLMLASRDPIALDAVACEIMGIPPYLITHLVLTANENVGIIDLNHITVTGNVTIADVQRNFVRATPGGIIPPYELATIPYRATTVIRTAPSEGITIDGDLGEWGHVNTIDINAADQVRSGDSWNGPRDCSMTGLFMYDATNLYFAACVRDTTKRTNSATGSAIRNGECIELYLSTYSPQYDANHGTSYMTQYDHVLGISYNDNPAAYMFSHNRTVTGFSAHKVETSDGYLIEARIPWSNFNNYSQSRYRQIGINVGIGDADVSPTSVTRKMYWNGADQSDIESNPQKLGMSYLDPAGGIYAVPSCMLTVNAEHGTVNKAPDAEAYDAFSLVTVTITPNDGYGFAGWSDGVTENPRSVFMRYATELTALFNEEPVLTSIAVSPLNVSIDPGASQQFTAIGYDQYNMPLSPQPSFSWSVSGEGTVTNDGLYHAAMTPGSATVTATSGTVSGSATVIVDPEPTIVHQINTGTNNAASPFSGDQFGSGGTMRSVSNSIDMSEVTGIDPAPQVVYQSERYGNSSYTIPNLRALSDYTVRLHFAELYQTATGRRRFHVDINGERVLTNFDIYAETGARYKATIREFTTTANGSGEITIDFITIADNATIGGIEIIAATPQYPPTIVTAASATPDPVTTTTTALSVLGDDDGGESSLIYTWATTGTPPAPVSFSINGSNSAKNSTATFTQAGMYIFEVTVSDAGGLSVTSSVNITVEQTPTSVLITPSTVTVNISETQQFSAIVQDQFGDDLSPQPSLTWSSSGSGSISSSGLYTAGSSAGTATISAVSSGLTGSARVTIVTEPDIVYQINTGSNNTVSPYTGDQYGSGGTMRTVSNTIDMSEVSGNDPAPQTVYRSERYGNSTYTFPNLTPLSEYTVRLHFAELYQTASGRRRFHAEINGDRVLTNFDIYAEVGARYKATIREFAATADGSGEIELEFITVTDNATIGGIEIIAATPQYPPTIVTAASATPDPVTATTTALSVLGDDDGGESSLIYTWATTGTPPAPVSFSINGSNSAKNSTATFTEAGMYSFEVTVSDAGGLSVTSSVNVTVEQTPTSVIITPSTVTVNVSETQQFSAVVQDQFSDALNVQPTLSWSVDGNCTIDANGLLTAGTIEETVTVTATGSSINGTASVTVTEVNTQPTVVNPASASPSPVTGTSTALSVLGDDDNGESNLIYTWTTTGTPPAPVSFSANGTNEAKSSTVTFTEAGTYAFDVIIEDAEGLSVTSSVSVTVEQTVTSVSVSPANVTLNISTTQQFTATARDQFGDAIVSSAFSWSSSGTGTIDGNGLFTAGSSAGSATVTAQTGTVSGTTDVTILAEPEVVYQINTGSNNTVSPFSGDQYGSGGTMRTVSNTIDMSEISGNDPAPQTVYRSERYGNSTYTIPNLTPLAEYTVRLHFAELYQTASGRRRFHVEINGDRVLSHFDIFAEVGARYKATIREFATTADGSGEIELEFITVTDNATIGGIEIIRTIPNNPPVIVQEPSATPTNVTGTTASLSVLGDDDQGESNLTYTWTAPGAPSVSFSPNGTNEAKNTTVTFSEAGVYTFEVTVADAGNANVTGTITGVTVVQTMTGITVSPINITMNVSETQQFAAIAFDQFGTAITPQPSFSWSSNGGGTIDANGFFTAGTVEATATVTASTGAFNAQANITITDEPQIIYQINTGSNSAVSPFSGDQYGSGGTMRNVNNSIDMSEVNGNDPAPQTVYRTERYGNSTYTVPNLTPSAPYTVRLHFAELYQTQSGRRIFDVQINNVTVLDNFDIFAQTGARYKATIREFTATANSSGQIVIRFITINDNATIEGIEVIQQ